VPWIARPVDNRMKRDLAIRALKMAIAIRALKMAIAIRALKMAIALRQTAAAWKHDRSMFSNSKNYSLKGFPSALINFHGALRIAVYVDMYEKAVGCCEVLPVCEQAYLETNRGPADMGNPQPRMH